MAVYQVTGPDGFKYEFNGPDDASDAQIYGYANQLYTQRQASIKEHEAKTGFMPALKAAGRQALGSVEALAAEATGNKALKQAAEEQKQKAAATFEGMTDEDMARAKESGILPTVGAYATKYVTEPLGGIAGRFGAPIAAGIGAGLAAPEVALGAIGAGALATGAADLPIELGENIQRQKEINPNAPVSWSKALPASIAQAALASVGIPELGVLSKVMRPKVLAEAEALAPRVVSGELTHADASQLLSSKLKTYAQSTATNAVSGTGLMVGTEELRRAQAGQDLMSAGEIGETALTAGVLAPIFGAVHPVGRGAAEAKLGEAEKIFKTKQEADLAVINAERQRQADIARNAQLDQQFNEKMQQVLKPEDTLALPPAREEQQVVFPDGTVGTHADAEAWVSSLPEEQQVAARAKLMGLGAQKADVVAPAPEVPGIRPGNFDSMSPLERIEQVTGVNREPTKLTKKMVEETLDKPSGQRIKDPVTQIEREVTYGELIQHQFPEMNKTQLKDHVYKYQDLLPLSTSVEEVATKRLGDTKQQDLFAEAPLTSLVPKLDKDTLTSLVPKLTPQAGVYKRLFNMDVNSPESLAKLRGELGKLGDKYAVNEVKLKEIEDAYKATTERKAPESIAVESGREAVGDSIQDTGGLGRELVDTAGAAGPKLGGVDVARPPVSEPLGGAGRESTALNPFQQKLAEQRRLEEQQRAEEKAANLEAAKAEQESIRLQQEGAAARAEQERKVAESQAKFDEMAAKTDEELPTVDERAKEPDVEDARPVPELERVAPGITKLAEETEAHKTFGETLTHMKNNYAEHLTEDQKILIDKLKSIKSVDTAGYELKDVPSYHKVEGVYRGMINKVEMRRDAVEPIVTLLHEGVHAATVHSVGKHLRNVGDFEPFTEKYEGKTESGKLLAAVFDKALEAAKNNTGFGAVTGKHNAFKNIREFIAEVYTNEKFQKFLASQPSVSKGKYATLWTDFVNAVKGMLGLKDVSTSMLSDAIAGSHEMFTEKPARGSGETKSFGKPREEPAPREDLDRIWKATGAKEKVEEQGSTAFQSIKEDPKEFAKVQASNLQRATDKFETMVFSSDAALNKSIHRAIKEAGLSDEAIKQLGMDISTSQALHSEAEAHQFLMDGGIKYNPELHKFETFEDPNGSWKGTIDAIKEAAEAQGVPYEEMERYAHKALEARRLALDIEPANDRLLKRVISKMQSGEITEAEGRKEWRDNSKEVHMTKEQIAAGMELFNKIPELNKVVERWDNVRKNVINFAEETGLYTAEKAAELFDTLAYVPFFRVEQLENQAGPKEFTRGLLDAATDKRFKGSHQEVNNVFDNMERWASYMVRKGINNKSAKSLVDASLKFLPDEVRQVENVAHGMRDNTFSIWENGHKVMYEFKDPLFVHAFTGMESIALPALEGFAKYANILRQNIVLNPLFSVGQLSQDAFGAMLSSGLKHPFALPLEVVKEFGKTIRGTSKTHEALKRTGTVGIRDYSSLASRVDAEITAGLKAPTKWQRFKQPFEKLSMASDNAVRQAIYNRTLLETGGKKMPDGTIKGGDKATAVERAFEIINFRRGGASKEIAALRRTVPFFGAYLQSLNVAAKVLSGRGISPTERKEAHKVLANNMIKVLTAGLIYNAMISEDEGYKKLDPAVRDRHLVIPGTDGMMIPLRPDVFTLFAKVIPEHLYQMNLAENTEDGTKAAKAIKTAMANALFSPNVMPQAIKPIAEVYLNKNMFTNQPIVGQGQEHLETALQYGPGTSELAKIFGKTGVMSPLNFDHIIKSYLGYTGGMALLATDSLIAGAQGETIPDKTMRDSIASIPGMSAFVSKEFGNRDMNNFYELKALTTEKVASLNKLKEIGSPEEVQEYMEKNRPLIIANKQVSRISENLSNLKKLERKITESEMTGPEKQEKLHELKVREHQMVTRIEELRKQAGL